MSAREKERVLRRALGDSTALARLWANVATAPTAEGCRLWMGPVTSEGGPTFFVGGRSVQPKRIAWSAMHGTVASGGTMVPVCGNARCVEPAHMRWRTRAGREEAGG